MYKIKPSELAGINIEPTSEKVKDLEEWLRTQMILMYADLYHCKTVMGVWGYYLQFRLHTSVQ